MSAEGSRIDPADTAVVTALKNNGQVLLVNYSSLKAMLGLLSYYRQYIKDFARIANPLYLYDLLKGPADGETQ